jgi:CheY-like chemotaxis protein
MRSWLASPDRENNMPGGDDTQSVPVQDLRGTVIYIEDDETNVAIVRGVLERHPGVRLLRAATAMEGVQMVRTHRPDWVLLDMHLPDTHGLEVVRMLNEDIANWKLRVTILTGDKLTIDVLKAMSLGAAEYWHKPISPQVLEAGAKRALAGSSKVAR